MRQIKNGLLSLFLFFLTSSLFSIEIFLAPVYRFELTNETGTFHKKNPTRDLYNLIQQRDDSGALQITRLLEKRVGVPQTLLDVTELCEYHGIQFLLYGYIKKTNHSYDAEIKLYDHEKHEIRYVFYAKDNLENYERMLKDLRGKIIEYFYTDLGLSPTEEDKEAEEGYIGLNFGLGYWTPIGSWSSFLSGIVTTDLGAHLVPVNPLFEWQKYSFFLRYGLIVSYALGMNKPDYESFYLHLFRIKVPVDLCAQWYDRHLIYFSLAPQLQFDLLIQDRLYDGPFTGKTSVMGLSLAIGYEYRFENSKFALGLSNTFDFAFYSNAQIIYRPFVYGVYRFNPIKSGEKESENP